MKKNVLMTKLKGIPSHPSPNSKGTFVELARLMMMVQLLSSLTFPKNPSFSQNDVAGKDVAIITMDKRTK